VTEYAKLTLGELLGHTVEIREKSSGKKGVANTCESGVQVFYGAEDGSDDKVVSTAAFNREFMITAVICS